MPSTSVRHRRMVRVRNSRSMPYSVALAAITEGETAEGLAFINAHGTATMFNDQMESVAIERAGLNETPVNAYKGYFGHTLGAAGVLETILSMAAADDHTILGTRGFEERGVSGKIKLSNQNAATNGQQFIKMISGFGGCNGAIFGVKSGEVNSERVNSERVNSEKLMTHTVEITPKAVTVDGKQMACEGEGKALLTDLYKRYIDNYPKFYKMDGETEDYTVSGALLNNAGIKLKQAFGGTGFDDETRLFKDFSSRMYFIESV